ncbi:MAG: lipid A-modifier LpxR family protein, partial [Pseudomonadota bacterium]
GSLLFRRTRRSAPRRPLESVFKLLERSHSVDKRPLVGNATIGLSVVWGRFKLSLSRVLRSREFDGQDRIHRFGSINITYTH